MRFETELDTASRVIAENIETVARQTVKDIIEIPGWAGALETVIASVQRGVVEGPILSGLDHADAERIRWTVVNRVEAILRDMATADPEIVFDKYIDLLPDELRREITARAVDVLKDCGVSVETFKDDNGTTFLHLGNVEALGGLPSKIKDRLVADNMQPVGSLHRVQ